MFFKPGIPQEIILKMLTSIAAVENSVEISLKTGNRTAI